MGAAETLKPERFQAKEAAALLGIEPKQLKALAVLREIPSAALLGSFWTFNIAEIERFAPIFNERREEFLAKLQPERVDTVYVIRCGYRVKIGFTKNIAQRLHSLKTANHRPIELLASWPAPKSEEKTLHDRFAALRVSGEWFALQKPIKEWLRDERGVRI